MLCCVVLCCVVLCCVVLCCVVLCCVVLCCVLLCSVVLCVVSVTLDNSFCPSLFRKGFLTAPHLIMLKVSFILSFILRTIHSTKYCLDNEV